MKKYFCDFFANDIVKARLSGDIEDNKISHAFIFEGAQGSGRHTLAKQLAASISCTSREGDRIPCGKCPSCSKIFAEKSPDVINLGVASDKVTIGIECARFIKDDIHTFPNSLPIKMYIIEDADKMTLQAQNALLLSLEEPPSYVIFVLICQNSAALLETIRSRAPLYRLEKIPPSEISRYLTDNYKKAVELKRDDPESFAELLTVSEGTIGHAIDLLDDKQRKKEFDERQIAKDFIELSLSRSKSGIFEMMASLGSKRPEICERLLLIQRAVRDLILLKKNDEGELIFYSNADNASEISAKITLERLMDMYSATAQAIEDLKANSNVKLTLLSMMYACKLAD